jgi:hypothetical protein
MVRFLLSGLQTYIRKYQIAAIINSLSMQQTFLICQAVIAFNCNIANASA